MRCTVLRISPLVLSVAVLPRFAHGQPQRTDTVYSRLIREYTTDPRFLPPSVATLPLGDGVPSPLRHFGAIAGAPGVMHRSDEIYGYFRALSKATPRVRLERIGTTEEGREIMLVVIADEETLRRQEEYRTKLLQLSDPRRVPADQVDAIVRTAKPVYYLNGGLHSPEMGSPETLTELAYRLAVSDDPAIRRIRESVIVIINPVSEPDGRDKQVDWYLRYTKGRPDFEDGFPRSSMFWGKYVVHDNNRDGIQISQRLTRAIYDTYYRWHPLVMHDLHESVPLLYVSTGTGPYNETNDPIAISEWQVLANNDLEKLHAQGLPGVWTWGFFDGWWPGYAMWVANNHNSIGRFYETFGNAGGDTHVRDLSNARYAGEPVTSRTWYRPWPPTARVRWSSRNNVNYTQAGVLASLTYAADNAQTLLRNFWQKGMNSITRGRTLKPHAYVIPAFARQRDPKRVAYLVNQLRRHAIEVHQVAAGDSVGDFVVLLNQPYRDLAVNLLSRQNFPATAQYPPYDDIAWTLGELYGVDVRAVDDTAVFQRPHLVPLRDTVAATASIAGSGRTWRLRYQGQGELLPAMYWLAREAPGARAFATEERVVAGGDTVAAGSVIIEGLDEAGARQLAAVFALPLTAAATPPAARRHELDPPRIAVFHTWYDTQDEGWSRFTLEQYGIPHTAIDKSDLRQGDLRQRFDVILFPQVRGDVQQIVHEVDGKWGPIPYRKTPATPALGAPFATDDITGGMGFEGLAHLRRFVEEGGTLITLGNSTRVAAGTGLARPLAELTTRALFHPGSVVRARARRTGSPILYGFGESFTVFRGNGPLFTVAPRDSALMVLQYGTRLPEPRRDQGGMLGIPDAAGVTVDTAGRGRSGTGSATASDYVVSGMVRGQEEIVGQGAIFDVPVGRGRIVAFTFDPLHRFLNHKEFPLVWNAMLNWNDTPGLTPTVRSAGSGEQ